MNIKYTEVKIAYAVGSLPKTIIDVLIEMEPEMANHEEGTGQYSIEQVVEYFDIDSNERKALAVLTAKGIEYIEA